MRARPPWARAVAARRRLRMARGTRGRADPGAQDRAMERRKRPSWHNPGVAGSMAQPSGRWFETLRGGTVAGFVRIGRAGVIKVVDELRA